MRKLLSVLAITLIMITSIVGCVSEEELREMIKDNEEEIVHHYRDLQEDWGNVRTSFQLFAHWISDDLYWLEYNTDPQVRLYTIDTLEDNLGDPAKFIRFNGYGSEKGDYTPLVDLANGHIWVYRTAVVLRPNDDVSWDDIEDEVEDTLQAWVDYQGL